MPTNGPIRVPGTHPPDWTPDHDANSCMSCASSFTLIKRRHHCRSCGKIFCGECCRLKAKLLYMDNKEARVCNNCYEIIGFTLSNLDISRDSSGNNNNNILSTTAQEQPSGSQSVEVTRTTSVKVQGVLKTSVNSSETSTNTSDQPSDKQVIFSDGIRPGTDLSEPPSHSTSDSPISALQNLLSRQYRRSGTSSVSGASVGKRGKNSKSHGDSLKNITVCDELGYLPPIVISKNAPIMNPSQTKDGCCVDEASSEEPKAPTNPILSQFNQTSMESRSCPLNEIVRFDEISDLVGIDRVVTLLLLKDFTLKVKLINKNCCMVSDTKQAISEEIHHVPPSVDVNDESDDTKCMSLHDETLGQLDLCPPSPTNDSQEFWCFLSDGLEIFGQQEVILVVDKDKDDHCIPRDVFKIYLTLHELALRRQALEHLGNLLFQDGLFGHKNTAGLLLVKSPVGGCMRNLILPKDNQNVLIALILQRWEVPWSKIFPMRLLLRLGHQYGVYPYPVASFRSREPVYYELGHTIISVLGDFRNFRYSLTHVEGLRVMLNKATKKVTVQISQSYYKQFNKVLDSANNEHVLAWSSCPIPDSHGHLVCVQNEGGQYETVEFYNKKSTDVNCIPYRNIDTPKELAASFIVLSGALKVNQTGQPAKISIVEDGLLIQIQSCTMVALRNAIHFMHHFDIDCENDQDVLNRVEIDWKTD